MSGEAQLYQFGAFTVDPVRRVLLRDGEPVPITPKSLSLLLVLLERRGEIISKEELIQRVWGGAQVSDANLMQNVSSLRKALGERAGDSRHVLTVPGQGYRFIGEVVETAEAAPAETAETAEAPERAETDETAETVPEGPPPAAPPRPSRQTSVSSVSSVSKTERLPDRPVLPDGGPPRRARFLAVLLIGLGVLLSLAGAGYLALDRGKGAERLAGGEPKAGANSRPGIAVLDLRNLSGDPKAAWLGPAFAEMLSTELAAGGRVRVVSGENVDRARRSLGDEALRNLDAKSFAKLHGLLGANMVIDGSYLAMPGGAGEKEAPRRVRLDLRVLSLPMGDPIASVAEVGEENDLFGLVARTGTRLRRVLGVADLTPAEARAAQALLPATPAAARLYIQGLERLRAFDPPGAVRLLQEAARADPESAPIRSALAQAWLDLGEDARAEAEAREALRLAAPLSREEKLAVEARLRVAGREWRKAADLYRSLATFYPDNLEYGLQLANSLIAAGSSEEASAVIDALRRLPRPVNEDPRIDLTEARLAKRLADAPREKRVAEAAAAKGNRSGEQLVVAQALLLQSDALLLLGRPGEALPLADQARELFAQAGHHLAVAMALAHRGVALHEMSDLDGAEEAYRHALAIAERLGSVFWTAGQKANLGLVYQARGDQTRALALLEEAHALYVKTEDRVLEARALNAIGSILRIQGELAGAQSHFEQALALSRRTGNRTDEAGAASSLGIVLAGRGSLREARRLHEDAFARLYQMGDQSRAASALAESARVVGALGDLALARRRLERALEAKRRTGDRIGAAEVLDGLAELALRQGDLAALRKMAGQQLQAARETGSPLVTVQGLRRSGQAALVAGDLAEARRTFGRALETAGRSAGELAVLEIRLDQARLELAEGRLGEALQHARESAAWSAGRDLPAAEAQAYALVADALGRSGDAAGAGEAAQRTRDALARTEDTALRLALAPHLARADVARGQEAGALRELKRAIEQAQDLGFQAAVLESRLVLGELLLAGGDPAAGRATLLGLQREARERGFGLVARKAGAPQPSPRG